jgi:hypothetical protein
MVFWGWKIQMVVETFTSIDSSAMRTEILTAAVTPVDTQANVAFLWNFQVAELLSANNFHMAL